MKNILIKIINIYQILRHILCSPPISLFPSVCRFFPTCSDYAIEVIERRGVIKGVMMAVQRIIKCNPFSILKSRVES